MAAMRTAIVAAVVLFCGQWSAGAQESSIAAPPAPVGQATGSPSPVVDVERLPVSMARLQRRLKASTERQAHEGLNLRYYVDVFGVAPPLVFFTKDDNLTTQAAPYGAPTHNEMIAAMTPRGLAPPPRGRIARRSRK
jgi:hypothetical protein